MVSIKIKGCLIINGYFTLELLISSYNSKELKRYLYL
jgi:hypothetical protein